MDVNGIINSYSYKINKGELEFNKLRGSLNKDHLLDQEQINEIVRLVDKKVQEIAT